MPAKRGTRGSESGRKTEVVTVRLDPRLKYLAELAARRQRRPLSSYIEWAIESSLSKVNPSYDPTPPDGEPTSFADEASQLWDVDEPDRFVKLAIRYPDLLDHEEQRLWKLIRENGYLWQGNFGGPHNEWQWKILENSFVWERLRRHWKAFCAAASGESELSSLPTWEKTKRKGPGDDLDDEIPF